MTDTRLNSLFLRYRDQGDVAALAELFDAMSPELLRVARHVAFDAAEAEDLVQAAFLVAMEHPERFDESRSFSAWLVGVVSKEALSWRRQAARSPDPERLTEGALAREVNERPDLKAADAETMSLLDAALARLPERYRDVLERHLRRGQSPSQIAEEKKASPATVRVQLHRGMAQLRQWIPAGAAGGFALTLSERGLAAVRAELVAHAKTLPLSTAAAVGGGAAGAGTLTSLLMLQRIALGALALVVLVFVGRQLLVSDRPRGPQPIAVSPTISGPFFDEAEVTVVEGEERVALVDESAVEADAESREYPKSLTIETRWADGSIAPGIGFTYQLDDQSNGNLRGETDDEGLFRIDDATFGTLYAWGDRGGHTRASVWTGSVSGTAPEPDDIARQFLDTHQVWTLPQGVDVRGRVLDSDGRGVAGASVWITSSTSRAEARVLTQSDKSGAFFLKQLSTKSFLGARSEEFAPSKPEHVQYWRERSDNTDTIEITLSLGQKACSVRGVVRDPKGAPIAGARLRLGAQAHFETFGPTGAEGPPPPLEVLTDLDGDFVGAGLTSGLVGWSCKADGYPPLAGEIEVPEGEQRALDIRLVEGGFVEGRLTDESGGPLPRLYVYSSASAYRYPNANCSFDEPQARTDEDGRFRIGPLAAGEVRLSARSWNDAEAFATLEVVPGATYTWNDILRGLPSLTGTATSETGEALVGWWVLTKPVHVGGPPPRGATVQGDGSFQITMASRGSGEVRLELTAPDETEKQYGSPSAPRAWLEPVAMDAKDVRLVLSPEQEPRARVRGRFVAAPGIELPKIRVSASHEKFREVLEVELPSGTRDFEFGDLPAGKLTFAFEPVGFAKLVREIGLDQDEVHDLGDLEITASGSFEAFLQRADGKLLERADVKLFSADGRSVYARREGSVVSARNLSAGSYVLHVTAQDIGPVRQAFEVNASLKTKFDVVLQSGGSIGLVFAEADDQPLRVSVTVRARSANGALFFDEVLEPREDGHVSQWIFAPHGELTLEATTETGRRLETQILFDPTDNTDKPRILRFE